MKKYFGLFRFAVRNGFAYPVVQFIWVGFSYLGVFMMSTVWSSAFASSGSIASGMSREAVLDYYVLVGMLTPFLFSNVSRKITIDDFKDGGLSNYLLRPYPYIGAILTREIGWRVVQGVIALPVGALLVYFHWESLSQVFSHASIVPFLISLPAAYCISYMLQFSISMIAFWISEMNGFIEFVSIVRSLLSGLLIPIFFLPNSLQQIVMYTPFYYNLAFPIQLLRGVLDTSQIMHGFVVWGVWCLLLYIIYKVLWKYGLGNFSAVGR